MTTANYIAAFCGTPPTMYGCWSWPGHPDEVHHVDPCPEANTARIIYLRKQLENEQHVYRRVADAAIEAFNPPDGDEGEDEIVCTAIRRAAAFIAAQNCTCTAERVEDNDPCPRCDALGRLGDQAVER